MNSAKSTRISIIIPAYNEEKYLPTTIKSIQAQTYKDLEIIVAVSPKTTDKTEEIARNLGAKVVEGGRVGRARNNGAKASSKQSKLLVFIDADANLPNNDFLKNAIREFETRNLDIATCFVSLDGSGIAGLIEKSSCLFYRYFEVLAEKYRAFPIGVFMIMKPEVLDIRGRNNCWGFDEDLSFAEEVELGQRIMNAGKRYGIIRQTLITSDRRFKNKGMGKVLWKYLYRGVALLFGHEFRYSKKSSNYFDEAL